MSRWATAAVALLLVSALGTSTLATCLAAPAVAPQAQMACCQNAHEQCPMRPSGSPSASDCCQQESQRHHELTAAEQQPGQVSWATLERIVAVTPHAAIPAATETRISARYSEPSTSPPPPRTALSTVLLI